VKFTTLQVDKPGEVTFADLQTLHHFTDLLIRLIHVLNSNIQVLRLLSKITKRRQKADKKSQIFRYHALNSSLDSSISEHGFHSAHSELVLKRAQGIATTVSAHSKLYKISISNRAQLRDAIALRDNETMKNLARLSESESKAMVQLGRRSTQDARTMKTITLVTLIYLPAMFTSVS
jgi:acid phosphatase family membrane protein YuiD